MQLTLRVWVPPSQTLLHADQSVTTHSYVTTQGSSEAVPSTEKVWEMSKLLRSLVETTITVNVAEDGMPEVTVQLKEWVLAIDVVGMPKPVKALYWLPQSEHMSNRVTLLVGEPPCQVTV